jgi:predicted Zn-dependent protease
MKTNTQVNESAVSAESTEFINKTNEYLHKLSHEIFNFLPADEQLKINYSAEDSLFIRFHEARVCQNTTVTQDCLSLELLKNNKSNRKEFSLSFDLTKDIAKALQLIDNSRTEFNSMEEDPFLSPLESIEKSVQICAGTTFDAKIGAYIADSVHSLDFNGLWASGPVIRASLNSLGADHFFASQSFFLDYSIYHEKKSVKGIFADNTWDTKKWLTQLDSSRQFHQLLGLPLQNIPKGKYRVYLAPQAVAEIVGLMNWGGFSQDIFRQGDSPFQKIIRKEHTLSSMFTLEENFELGLGPTFNSFGENSPTRLPLIQNGEFRNLLTNKRSSKEYNLPSNQAESNEGIRSPEIHTGSLDPKQVLKTLDTGIFISNLHYLNWSDRPNARITGMTRYACFWVEHGEIKGPIQDLRFDESLLDCFGLKLAAITQTQEIIPNTETYESRRTGGAKLPGLLINDFTFTL